MAIQPKRPRSRLSWRWAVSITGVVFIAALMGAGLLGSGKPQTVLEVRDEIYNIVLSKSGDEFWDHGGIIGPWHVAATSIDDSTGDLHDFRLVSGSINLGASRARLVIDPEQDTFSFHLRDVVIMNVPNEHDLPTDDRQLIPLDAFILGPAKYHRPIIAGTAE